MVMGLPNRWDTCSRTIFFEGPPRAFARCGGIIAVGIESNVVLLDAITGMKVSVLSGHKHTIKSLASSLDGTLLASVGHYGNFKLWDVQTGGVIRAFHTIGAISASISPDGATIALGTRHGAIHLWDVQAWKCHSIETRQRGAGRARRFFRDDVAGVVKFSPTNSQRLLFSPEPGTVQQWDVDGHQIGTSYHEEGRVQDFAYALDGARFVSCGGKVATVRDSESGAVVVQLGAPDQENLSGCCFSPDGRFVACKANTIIYVWDITLPKPRLVGQVEHSDSITFIAFSSSLISGSHDRSVKFWQSSSFLTNSTTTDHTIGLHGSTPVKSVNLFAEDGIVVTSDSSGMVKTWDLATGSLKSSFSTPAKGERDARLADDTLIIVWWANEEKEFNIWDVYKSQLLRRFHSPSSDPRDLKISGDGSKIFGLGSEVIEVVSMQTGEDTGGLRIGFYVGFSLFVWGSKMGINNQRDRGWDFGGPTVSGYGKFPDRPRLDFAKWPTGRSVAPCWIEDTVTKRRVFHLPERYTRHGRETEWDGRYLLVRFRPVGEVVILDFNPVSPR